MTNAYLHPGVYIEELAGPQQITGAGTSTTVFVGWTEFGPANTPTLIDSWNAFTRTFGNFVFGRNVAFAVFNFFAEGGAIAYVVNAQSPPNAMLSATYAAGDLTITAAAPGAWGNSLAFLIENYPTETPPSSTAVPIFVLSVAYMIPTATPTTTDQIVAHYAQVNNLKPQGPAGSQYWVLEQFPGLTASDMAKASATAVSAIEAKINARSIFIRVQVTDTAGTRPGNFITPTELAGGAGDLVHTPIDYPAALSSLDPQNDISLIVAPDTSMIDDLGVQRETVQEIINYCEGRAPRDLFYIADAPFGLDVQDVTAFKTGTASGEVPTGAALNSSYAALYYPWIDFFNGLTSLSVPMPPSGAIAGTYAETDNRVGVFKAPAGIQDGKLSTAVGLAALVTATDQDILNPNGINAIRNLPRYGIVTYGARTLSLDPSLIYVNVRRILTYIEVSLYWGTQWVVFESNDQQLWGGVNRDVSQFLTQFWQQGGLFGTTESQAFLVQVGAANNPPASRNQGILYIDISVAPVRPAEFVVIRIQQSALPSA